MPARTSKTAGHANNNTQIDAHALANPSRKDWNNTKTYQIIVQVDSYNWFLYVTIMNMFYISTDLELYIIYHPYSIDTINVLCTIILRNSNKSGSGREFAHMQDIIWKTWQIGIDDFDGFEEFQKFYFL